MVDVSEKAISARVAVAEGFVELSVEALALVRENAIKKGDVLAVSRIAGIMAGKETSRLIPLCHPLSLTSLTVDFQLEDHRIRIVATAKTRERTGVEMEALTAVTVAALTIYDMCKAVDRSMRISGVRLLEKEGGRSGHYRADLPDE